MLIIILIKPQNDIEIMKQKISCALLLFFFIILSVDSRAQCTAEGGTISTSDPTTICAGDGINDPINTTLSGQNGMHSGWVITSSTGEILALPTGPPFDLEGAGAGTCLIWHISYDDGLTGLIVGENTAGLMGCFDLSNEITVTRNGVNGGVISGSQHVIRNRVVIANRASGSISVINSDNDNVIGTYDMPNNGEPMYVVHNETDHSILVGNYKGSVVAFNDKDFSIIGEVNVGKGVFHMWLSPDNKQLWVNNEIDKSISVVDPLTMTEIIRFDIPTDLKDNYKPHDVIVMPDNSAAFVTFIGSSDMQPDYVLKYDAVSFDETARAAVGRDPHVSLTSANPYLYVASQDASELKVLNRSDLSEETTLNIPNAHGLGMNHAGTYLYVGNISQGGMDATYTVDLSTNTILGTPVSSPASAPHNYAVNAKDDKLYLTHSGSNDIVSVYDLSPTPVLTKTIQVGTNPFGLTSYSYEEDFTEITICALDGSNDPFDVNLTDQSGTNSGWVITSPTGEILGLPAAPPFDLEGAGAGTCLIWHISYNGGLTGLTVGENTADLMGCFDFSNQITVTRDTIDMLDGGMITTTDPTTICAGDGVGDPIDVNLSGALGTNNKWIITDTFGNILGLPAAPPFDLDGAGEGVCVIWHMSHNDGLLGLEVDLNVNDLQGCFDLSNNIAVTRNGVDGGNLMTVDGETALTICAGDGASDAFFVTLSDELGTNSGWVITSPTGEILGLPAAPPFDLEGAGAGTCLIWHISYNSGLTGLTVGENTADLMGCFDFSNQITVTRDTIDMLDGGMITTTDPTTICAGDGVGDPIDVNLSGALGTNNKWIITDTFGNILGLPAAPPFDLDGAGEGVCVIWHMSHNDGLLGLEVGLNVNDLQGCFDLSNNIAVTRNGVDGGNLMTVDGETALTICAGDGASDAFFVTLSDELGTNSGWVITSPTGEILGLPAAPPFDLEGAGAGTCLIWHISYNGGLTGLTVGQNTADLMGCFDFSNQITVTRDTIDMLDGGMITTTDPTTICAGDGVGDPIDVNLSGALGTNNKWIITDTFGNILGLPAAPPFDLDGAGEGVCVIWHMSHNDGLLGLEVDLNVNDLQGCFDLSNNIAVTRNGVDGGNLMTVDGETALTICAGDGASDAFFVTLSDELGTNSGWVITSPTGEILGLPAAPPFDLEGAGAGTCLIWHISYNSGLTGLTVGENTADLMGCFDFSNEITVTRNGVNGGQIETSDGETEIEICVNDGVANLIEPILTGAVGDSAGWIITDTSGNILGLPQNPPFDLEPAGIGVCRIWHLEYNDILTGNVLGNNISDISGCFDLSNYITVTRDTTSSICFVGTRNLNKELDAQIYPTLTSDFITIELNEQAVEFDISIFSLSGHRLYSSENRNNSEHRIDVSNLQSGMYLIELISKDAYYRNKFMKIE